MRKDERAPRIRGTEVVELLGQIAMGKLKPHQAARLEGVQYEHEDLPDVGEGVVEYRAWIPLPEAGIGMCAIKAWTRPHKPLLGGKTETRTNHVEVEATYASPRVTLYDAGTEHGNQIVPAIRHGLTVSLTRGMNGPGYCRPRIAVVDPIPVSELSRTLDRPAYMNRALATQEAVPLEASPHSPFRGEQPLKSLALLQFTHEVEPDEAAAAREVANLVRTLEGWAEQEAHVIAS